jgi:sec-independent protein translocase protein TatB
MYLFILESIGTSELILIGIVALIVFGPRKLPQMARTLGKMMAEFRSTTSEFRSTWEREASFEEEKKQLETFFEEPAEDNRIAAIPQKHPPPETFAPEIREVSAEEIKEKFDLDAVKSEPAVIEKSESDKRDWL